MALYSVRLDEASAEALAAAAQSRKVSRAVIVREAIADYASGPGREVAPAALLSSLIGVIEDGPGNLSDQTGKGFARLLESRRATPLVPPAKTRGKRLKRTVR